VRNFYSVDHRAIYLDSGLVYKVVGSHYCLLILQNNTEIWLNATNYFTARKLKGINMKKILTASLISACLAGCGSDDKNNGLDVDLSQFKGSESVRSISNGGSVSDGSALLINQKVTGNIIDGSSVNFNFNHSPGELVTAKLSSSAEDLDLFVYGGTVDVDSTSLTSNELVIFNSEANQDYSVQVESFTGGGAFDLTLNETTRDSLNLSNNEYLVSFSYSYSENCSYSATPIEGTNQFMVIVNFNDGYMDSLSRTNSISFSKVSGNSFTLASSNSGTDADGPYEDSSNTTYTLNLEAGTLTGSGTSSYSYTYNGSVNTCESTENHSGEIIF
jgi:hypothetical protein